MPPRNGNDPSSPPATDETLKQLKRIANLLALLAVKGETQPEKVQALAAAGFSVAEIAGLLATKPNTISVVLYKSKKAKPKRAK